MILYDYDICDGDKGVITADTEEEAIKIFQREYEGIPVLGVDTGNYDSKVCCITEVGELNEHVHKLYFIHD